MVLVPTIFYPVILPVYGNVDGKVHKSNSISKAMFAAHVNAMHRNRDEGFETEFEVSVYCVRVCACVFACVIA